MDFNAENYVFFILDKAHRNNARFGFRAEYYDREGEYHSIRLDKVNKDTGEKLIKKYSIQKGHGSLRINKNRSEEIEFLRNHPRCAGSPNGTYRDDGKGGKVQMDVWFTELNTEKAAEEGVKAKTLGLTAANKVMEFAEDSAKLMQLASVLGYRGTHNEVLFKLIEHAQKMPDDILNEIENPSFKAKAMFKQALAKKIIVQKGITFKLEEFELGIDEESCIKTIVTDKDVEKLLAKKLKNA